VVSGTVLAEWTAQGGEGGALGYPSRGLVCGLVRGGCFQDFTGGAVYSSPTGTWTVRGAIQAAWGAQGWERGSLGYPTGDAVTASGTVTQPFEGGTLVQDVATGRVTRR
jgi:uncharacterized protein with LGFP repeats